MNNIINLKINVTINITIINFCITNTPFSATLLMVYSSLISVGFITARFPITDSHV